MEFRVLGPIEVVADSGESVPLGGSRPRALLAALLLEPGLSVAREALIDALWASPPATASHAVDVWVSRLRQTMGRDRISCQGRAYRVQLEPDELDLVRFRRLVRLGRDAAAVGDAERAWRELCEALALWRGEALGCLDGEPFAQHARSFLEEERLVAVEAEVDARLELGLHDELVPDLRRLAGANPTRERLWSRLMLALYRCGRQIDALEVFAGLRSRLRHEFGIEPGPDLRGLQRRILEHDPALEVGRLAPALPR